MLGPHEMTALHGAIREALDGLERAAVLVPPTDLIWKGRLLRLRAALADEARLRHVHVAHQSDAGSCHRSEASEPEPRFVQESRSVA